MWKSIQSRFESSDSFLSLTLGIAVVLAVGMLAFNYFTQNQPAPAASGSKPTDTQAQPTGSTALPSTYVVKTGDSLWTIAEQYYKSGYNWVDIAKSNQLTNGNSIEVGQKLNIPNAPVIQPTQTGQISSAMTERVIAKDKTYKVVAGDSLWTIAVKQYNDGYKWTEIAKTNKLANPNLIHTGNELTMP